MANDPGSSSRRVYIIDDDHELRKSLFYMLVSAGFDPRVFGSGIDFLAELPGLLPGVLLLDLQMADLDGLALAQRMHEDHRTGFPIVMLTGHGDMAAAVRALRLGIRDFLEKPYGAQDLLDVLDRLSAEIANDAGRRAGARVAARRLAQLTPREADVLERLLHGRMNKEIAHDLGLSVRTIEMHRSALFQRLEVRTLADALRLAASADWTTSASSRGTAKRPD